MVIDSCCVVHAGSVELYNIVLEKKDNTEKIDTILLSIIQIADCKSVAFLGRASVLSYGNDIKNCRIAMCSFTEGFVEYASFVERYREAFSRSTLLNFEERITRVKLLTEYVEEFANRRKQEAQGKQMGGRLGCFPVLFDEMLGSTVLYNMSKPININFYKLTGNLYSSPISLGNMSSASMFDPLSCGCNNYVKKIDYVFLMNLLMP